MLPEYFGKFKRGVDFMEDHEKGDIKELCTGEKMKITNIDFLPGESGEYAVFMVDVNPDTFYFGNSVVNDVMLQIRTDGMLEDLKSVNVVFREAISKKNRAYVAIDFVE